MVAAPMREKALMIWPTPVNRTKPTLCTAPSGPTWRVRMLLSKLRAEVPAHTTVRGTAAMAGPAPPSTCKQDIPSTLPALMLFSNLDYESYLPALLAQGETFMIHCMSAASYCLVDFMHIKHSRLCCST